ncbi:hypothetical protein Tco_0873163 [Tanacetum coccineum]
MPDWQSVEAIHDPRVVNDLPSHVKGLYGRDIKESWGCKQFLEAMDGELALEELPWTYTSLSNRINHELLAD